MPATMAAGCFEDATHSAAPAAKEAIHAATIDVGDHDWHVSAPELRSAADNSQVARTSADQLANDLANTRFNDAVSKILDQVANVDPGDINSYVAKACQLANIQPESQQAPITLPTNLNATPLANQLRSDANASQQLQFDTYILCQASGAADGLNS